MSAHHADDPSVPVTHGGAGHPHDGVPPELRLSLAFELFTATQRLGQVLEQVLAPAGLRPAEYALYSLMDEAGRRTPSELAAMLGVAPTTMSDLLRRLVERGHAKRIRNLRDGRSHLVALTPAGVQAMHDAGPLFDAAMRIVERHLAGSADPILEEVRRFDRALRGALAELGAVAAGDDGDDPDRQTAAPQTRPLVSHARTRSASRSGGKTG